MNKCFLNIKRRWQAMNLNELNITIFNFLKHGLKDINLPFSIWQLNA